MTLSEETLRARLGDRPFRFYPEIGSTNDAAREWLESGAPSGAVVIADTQTAGRGRFSRVWQTPPGSALAVSLILKPPQKHIPQVTMLGAVAVAEMLERIGAVDVAIKWPNDVLLNGRKVCGILSESDWKGSLLRGVILGIGLNISVDFTDSPLQDTAISIETALRRAYNRVDILDYLLEFIDKWLARLGTDDLYHEWMQHLKTLGEQVRVSSGAVSFEGIAIDARPDGALIVQTADGKHRAVYGGEVTTATGS